jgi:hypothetical protein
LPPLFRLALFSEFLLAGQSFAFCPPGLDRFKRFSGGGIDTELRCALP